MHKHILILPMTALLAGLACGKHETAPAPALPTAKIQLAAGAVPGGSGWIAATLTATRRATLATRMAASVQRVLVKEGMPVAAGTLLISLADGDLQGGLKAAEAAVAAAQAHFHRIEALARQTAATPSELELAATQLAQAQGGLAGVRANLAYTQIRAPFAGVVQSRLVDAGALVGPGQPLVILEGQGELELEGSVSEAEAQGLKIGQKVPFEVEGRAGTAEITALATGGDPVTHRGTVRARLLGKLSGYRSGSFARLQIPGLSATQGLTVPVTALVRRGELTGVFVARAGKAELHWLSLGQAQGGNVPVRAGLVAADQVIDQPGTLVDGQPVEVAK